MTNKVLPLLLLSVVIVASGCETAHRLYLIATYRTVRVPNENMKPTIQPGDYASVDESYYKVNPVKRFDVVMFKNPAMVRTSWESPDTMYIMRIIALGGEKIEVKHGVIYINDKKSVEPFATIPFTPEKDFAAVVVQSGECYLLGDNRSNSFDSRFWEKPTLNNKLIAGKVIKIIPQ